MTSHGSQSSGCTPFEQELMIAMNDFAHSARTPHFDTAAIARRARRKTATSIAGIATALLVAGAGTALAAGTVGGASPASRPTAATTTAADNTTVVFGERNGTTVTVPLAGVTSPGARAALVRLKLTPEFSRTPVAGCKQSTVVSVSPHAPTVVHAGDTVHVTVCAG